MKYSSKLISKFRNQDGGGLFVITDLYNTLDMGNLEVGTYKVEAKIAI